MGLVGAQRGALFPDQNEWRRGWHAHRHPTHCPPASRDPIFWSNLSAAHASSSAWVEAARTAQRAIDLDPKWPKARARLAAAYAGMDDHTRVGDGCCWWRRGTWLCFRTHIKFPPSTACVVRIQKASPAPITGRQRV